MEVLWYQASRPIKNMRHLISVPVARGSACQAEQPSQAFFASLNCPCSQVISRAAKPCGLHERRGAWTLWPNHASQSHPSYVCMYEGSVYVGSLHPLGGWKAFGGERGFVRSEKTGDVNKNRKEKTPQSMSGRVH
eukprot:1145847-Pelagomonas_calceolata.AAC.8